MAMNHDQQMINNYLTRLDQAMGPIPTADKAEIVLEIKNHLEEARIAEPEATWESLFTKLGRPEQVANKYLVEKGFKTQRVSPAPSNNSVLKWLVICFLGFMSLMTVFIIVMFYMFTPLFSVDEKTGRVQLFGGAVDVNSREVISFSKNGNFVFGTIEGNQKLGPDVDKIHIKFGAGQVSVDYNESEDEFNWDCDGAGKSTKLKIDPSGVALLDLSSTFVECNITIPNMDLKLEGMSGRVDVQDVRAPLEIALLNGDVNLKLLKNQEYKFDLAVQAGEIGDGFKSSENETAILIKAALQYGSISKLD